LIGKRKERPKCVCPKKSNVWNLYQTNEELERRTAYCIQNEHTDLNFGALKANALKVMASSTKYNQYSSLEDKVLFIQTYKTCEDNMHAILHLDQDGLSTMEDKYKDIPFSSNGANEGESRSLVAFDVDMGSNTIRKLTDYTRRINIICVLKNRGGQLQHFLRSLSAEHKLVGFDLILSIYDYDSEDIDVESTLAASGIQYRYMQGGNSTFSKVAGLHALIAAAKETDVIFIADIDYHIPHHVLSGILKYTVEGHSVYMPIPWMIQDSDVLEGKAHVKEDLCKQQKLPPKCALQTYVESMKRDQYMSMPSELTWAFGGYGPIAFYQSDFNGLDAFNLERFGTSHGFEDTDIAYRIYSCNLLMIRDPVYDFVHLPHVTNSWGKDDVID